MNLEEKLNHILPPIDDTYLHITGEFGEARPGGKTHQGVDFNYMGGQKGLNLTHPKIYSPVDGEVTFVKGNFGTIKIKDAEGMSHELFHTHHQTVKVGEQVHLGDELGSMGGKGPLGYHQYPQHVHYQIKNPLGEILNPHHYWEKKSNLEWKEVLSGSSSEDKLIFPETKATPIKHATVSDAPIVEATFKNSLVAFEAQAQTQVEVMI